MREMYKVKSKILGTAYAKELYKDFLNPINRGSAFSWDKFPNICGRLAKASLFTTFSNEEWSALSERDKELLEKICYDHTVRIAKELKARSA